MVINFSVVGDIKRAIFIGHRLMTGRNVDNTEAAVAEPDIVLNKDPFIVRPAVGDDIAHSLKHAAVYSAPRAGCKSYAVNATHN